MWDDPIVKETRRLREEYASPFKDNPKGDSQAILEDIENANPRTRAVW